MNIFGKRLFDPISLEEEGPRSKDLKIDLMILLKQEEYKENHMRAEKEEIKRKKTNLSQNRIQTQSLFIRREFISIKTEKPFS